MRSIIDQFSATEREIVLAVADFLATASTDVDVLHADVAAVVGFGPPSRSYYDIVGAARTVLNERSGAVVATIKGVGYRRLASEPGVGHVGRLGLGRVRKTARRFSRLTSNALRHANDITPEARREASQRLASLGLIEELTRPAVVRSLPEKTTTSDPLRGLKDALGV